MIIDGKRGKVTFTADTGRPDSRVRRACELCGGGVVRSYRTGILHRKCFTCRYLVMIYGPNIGVRRIK